MGSKIRFAIRSRQKGASMIEYALLIAFVATVATALFSDETQGLGKAIADKIAGIATTLSQ